jgi:non-ribosomal peptide synthase protein (TIGR01720 family)
LDAGTATAGRLLLTAHHLVVDGVSWRILLEDLANACQGKLIEPTGTSFRAWSFALRRQAPVLTDELPVWRDMLAGPASQLVHRPVSTPRDVLGATERIEVRAPADLTGAILSTLPRVLRAQTQEVLLAALVVALAEAGEPSPLLRLEGHGREEDLVGDTEVDLARTVGWFTSAFPIRLGAEGVDVAEVLAGGASGGTLVKRVRETLRGLPHRGAGYGVLRHLLPKTAAELGALPEPVIGFNYLGRFDARAEGDWTLVPGGLSGGGDPELPVAHALDVNVLIDDEGLRASWTHLPELISAEQTRRIADTWLAALHGLARYGEQPEAAAPGVEDFDLVKVSTTQLDRLRQRFGG